MTSISTSGSSIIFTFEESPYYLNNGSIEVPKNSLALIVDSSEMATFKKAGADDIFLSIKYDDLGMTKDELIEYYQENMTGGGGSEEEIQELSGQVSTLSGTVTSHTSNNDIHVTTQDKSYWDGKADASDIEEAVSGKADSSAVTEEISAAVSGKADSSAVTDEISAAVSGKADSSAVTEDIEAAVSGKADSSAVTEEISAAVSGKADSSAVTEQISEAVSGKADSSAVTEDIEAAVSGKADSSAVTDEISAAVSGKADTSALTSHTSNNDIHVTTQDKTNWDAKADASDIEEAVSGKADSSSVTDEISAAVSGKADTSALTSHTADTTVHVTSTDKTNWDGAVTASTANTTALGGVKLVKITQSAYDQLQTKDPDTLYIITES